MGSILKSWKIFEEMPVINWRWDIIMGVIFLIILTIAVGAPLGA
tara:strand:+ start:642 stop:773 length:132 start_codon:yes stop_codon:yes gene_type:complete